MFDFLVKFVISLVVSHWVYSEAVLMVPEFHDFAANFYRTVRIPTHNEWPEIVDSQSAKQVESEVSAAWRQVSNTVGVEPSNLLGAFTPDVRNLWSSVGLGKMQRLFGYTGKRQRTFSDFSSEAFRGGNSIRIEFASDTNKNRKS